MRKAYGVQSTDVYQCAHTQSRVAKGCNMATGLTVRSTKVASNGPLATGAPRAFQLLNPTKRVRRES